MKKRLAVDETYQNNVYNQHLGSFGQDFNMVEEADVALVDSRTNKISIWEQMNLQKIQIILSIITIFLTAWFISIKLKEAKKS